MMSGRGWGCGVRGGFVGLWVRLPVGIASQHASGVVLLHCLCCSGQVMYPLRFPFVSDVCVCDCLSFHLCYAV